MTMRVKSPVVTKIVSNADEMAQVFAIRSAVYLAEQQCPYDEEFDGNDYSATHVLGLVDGQPAACVRWRWFADFAKGERMAVLPAYRGTGVSARILDKSFDLCRRKGYRRVLVHAQRHLVRHWMTFGFQVKSNQTFQFSDFEYVTMIRDLTPDARALTVDSDPMLLIRPDEDPDRPGVLERSAQRQVPRTGRLSLA